MPMNIQQYETMGIVVEDGSECDRAAKYVRSSIDLSICHVLSLNGYRCGVMETILS